LEKQRARLDEEKAEKRIYILKTAERLFLEQDFSSISVSSIAENSGIAKGTVYLYFKTKEEIYLELLEKEFHKWLDNILDELKASDNISIEKTVKILTDFIFNHQYFLRLATISGSILEKNISDDVILSYKGNLGIKIFEAGLLIEEKVKGVKEGEGAKMLIRSYGIVTGLWSTIELPPKVKNVMLINNLEMFVLDYFAEAKETLNAFWWGSVNK
jgi:TetR/AcrR family transcriptional regulator